jgi:hypothetical protein
VLGVPPITPEPSNESPGGSVPVADQVQLTTHPEAVRVWEYATFTVQLGSVAGLIVIAA